MLATTKLGKMRRLDRAGRTLSEVGSIAGGSSASFIFKGPFDADLSPDGAKIAYGYVYSGFTNANGGTYVNEGNATAFARSSAATEVGESGFKTSREYDGPEWIDDTRVLVSNGPGYPSDPFAIVQAGSGDSRSWFTDPDNMHPHDATLSRGWRMIAATNSDRSGLHVYRDFDAQPLGDVSACFVYTPDAPGRRYSSPTFNAAGSRLFWANGAGLEVADIGDATGACPQGVASKEVLPGGSSPDWGPADVPAARAISEVPGWVNPNPTPASAPTAPTPGPTPTPGSGTTSAAGAKGGSTQAGGQTGSPEGPGPRASRDGSASLALAAPKTRLRPALANGLAVKVSAPAAGKVSVLATAAGTSVASGHATAKKAGLVTVKLTFTAAAKRKYTRKSKLALTLAARQGTSTGSVKTTLKR
jgi:hypothetical protein